MNHETIALVCGGLVFVGIVAFTLAGHRFGRWHLRRSTAERVGVGAVEGAVFALLGLLIAFTFHGAYGRFETRRQLIVQEANAIETGYARLDLLPSAAQAPLRALFLDYADARGAFFVKLNDPPAAAAELARATALQKEIWQQAVAATSEEGYQTTRLLVLPAINEMMSLTTTRAIAVQTHPPLAIFLMLFGLAIGCAALTGYGMAKNETPSIVYVMTFAAVTAFTFFVILDMEYPRYGFIRLDTTNELLVDMRKTLEQMGPTSAPR